MPVTTLERLTKTVDAVLDGLYLNSVNAVGIRSTAFPQCWEDSQGLRNQITAYNLKVDR